MSQLGDSTGAGGEVGVGQRPAGAHAGERLVLGAVQCRLVVAVARQQPVAHQGSGREGGGGEQAGQPGHAAAGRCRAQQGELGARQAAEPVQQRVQPSGHYPRAAVLGQLLGGAVGGGGRLVGAGGSAVQGQQDRQVADLGGQQQQAAQQGAVGDGEPQPRKRRVEQVDDDRAVGAAGGA